MKIAMMMVLKTTLLIYTGSSSDQTWDDKPSLIRYSLLIRPDGKRLAQSRGLDNMVIIGNNL